MERKMTLQAWQVKNAKIIEQMGLATRHRDVPDTGVPVKMVPGDVYKPSELPNITIAAGVTASVSWGSGAMLELLDMQPDSVYPLQAMTGELFTVVEEGSAACELDGAMLELRKGSLLFMTDGMVRSLKAGPQGLKALEIFSPVRVDHLELAGVDVPTDASVSFADQGVGLASLEVGKLYQIDDIPWTAVGPPSADPDSVGKACAQARIAWGKNVMISFVQMEPNSQFPMHIHPEDQLMVTLQGRMIEGLAHAEPQMLGVQRHHIFQPGGMAHSARLSPEGAECLDVFWPVRPDYLALSKKQHGDDA